MKNINKLLIISAFLGVFLLAPSLTLAETAWCHTFNTNLSIGSSNSEVKYLQIALNKSADTQIASSGTGSPGNESDYFGQLTKNAVIKFQNKYGISPAVGYFGSISRSKMNSLHGCASGTTSTTNTTATSTTAISITGTYATSTASTLSKSTSASISKSETATSTTATADGTSDTTSTTTSTTTTSTPVVNTYSATSITSNSVTLKGRVTSNASSTVWFTYDTSTSFKEAVNSPFLYFGIDSSTDFDSIITGLSPNTTYYYYAAAQSVTTQGNSVISFGSTLSFTTPSASSSSITISYPNGGETLYQGNTYDIRWSTMPLGSPEYVGLNVVTDDDRSLFSIGNVKNTGLYSWTVPTTYSGSGFKIKAFGESVSDTSDSWFSIFSSTTAATMTVSADPSFSSKSVSAGSSNVEIGRWNFAADDISSMKVVTIDVGRTSKTGCYLQNLKLYDGSTQVGPTISALDTNCEAKFDPGLNGLFTVPKSSTKTISLKADIYSSAKVGDSFSFQISGVSGDFEDSVVNSLIVGIPAVSSTITVTASSSIPPVITSLSPYAGPAGTAVTISGSGFDSGAKVIFAGIKTKGSPIDGTNLIAPASVSSDGKTLKFSVQSIIVSNGAQIPIPAGYYYISVQNSDGKISNIYSFVFTSAVPTANSTPIAVTYPPSSISMTASSARLNGQIKPNGLSGSMYFEWGASKSLGNKTEDVSFDATKYSYNHSASISGLNSGTVYYCRAVASNANGISYGATVSFQTTGATQSGSPSPTTSTTPTTSATTPSTSSSVSSPTQTTTATTQPSTSGTTTSQPTTTTTTSSGTTGTTSTSPTTNTTTTTTTTTTNTATTVTPPPPSPYVNVSVPAGVKLGIPLVAGWSSNLAACRASFQCGDIGIQNLPASGVYTFPTNQCVVGNGYAFAVRCFPKDVMTKYGNNTAIIPMAEGIRAEKPVLVIPPNVSAVDSANQMAGVLESVIGVLNNLLELSKNR